MTANFIRIPYTTYSFTQPIPLTPKKSHSEVLRHQGALLS